MTRIIKRTFALILSLTVVLSSFAAVSISSVSAAEVGGTTEGSWEKDAYGREHFVYFYHQLNDVSKLFYDAMREMYNDGSFFSGEGEYDLTANGVVTQNQAEAFAMGDVTLLNNFGAAKDAFCADYADLFYINADYLSIVVTRNTKGVYKATLGTGRSDTYYAEGFDSEEAVNEAREELYQKIDEYAAIAEEAAEAEEPANLFSEEPTEDETKIEYDMQDMWDTNTDLEATREKSDEEKKVTSAHYSLIENTAYKLETECTPGNKANVRTAYGALVKQESLCEGYSRAFKCLLDALEIPCVLVQGVYRHTEDALELHMWNYVQLGDTWYGVDSTFDDPIFSSDRDAVKSGMECGQYLLVGDDEMSRQHVPSGVMSESMFEFTYPALELSGFRYESTTATNGLIVKYTTDYGLTLGEGSNKIPAFIVSYKGMNYFNAIEKEGRYILYKFYGTSTEDGSTVGNEQWAYADTGMFPGLPENDDYLIFPAQHLPFAEFAVTDVPPRGPWYPGQYEYYPTMEANTPQDFDNQYYYGDLSILEAESGLLHNPEGTYLAPPYIKRSVPSQSGVVYLGNASYDACVVYDQPLVTVDDESSAARDLVPEKDYVVYVYDKTQNDSIGTINPYDAVKDMKFDGDRTFTFTFEPGSSFAADSVFFVINFKGYMGQISRKTPNDASFLTKYPCAVCAYRSRGYNMNVFGKPQLMENTDLSAAGWKDKNGNEIDEALSHRITLVAMDTTPSQSAEMLEKIKEQKGVTPIEGKASTYNISLTVCKMQAAQLEDNSVRISVGFPEGYGPEDEGVKFVAYHFIKDENGETIGVEEIPCEVTKYGLVLLVDAFSPFAILPVEATQEEIEAAKARETLIVSSNAGGSVEIETLEENNKIGDSMAVITEDAPATVTVTPFEGYVVDNVIVGTEKQEIQDRNGTNSFEVNYDGNTDVVAEVTFIKETVIEKEEKIAEETGETVVQSEIFDPEAQEKGDYDVKVFFVTKDGSRTLEDKELLLGETGEDGRPVLPDGVTGYVVESVDGEKYVPAGIIDVDELSNGGADEVSITTCRVDVSLLEGAQVRCGDGVDSEGKVAEGSGLRFIAHVDKEALGGDVTGRGVEITAQGSDVTVEIPAEKYQDDNDEIFTAVLTNLNAANYNRPYTARAYVDVRYTDGSTARIYSPETITRSIYQVSAALLNAGNDEEDGLGYTVDEAILKVINAYVNTVGVRMNFKGGEFSMRNEGDGAYSGDILFGVTSVEKEDGVYTVTVKPLSEKLNIMSYWKEFVRLNNNNTEFVKHISEDTINDDGSLTFTFTVKVPETEAN